MSVITLDDMKSHLNVTTTDDDTLITAKIAAAEAFITPYVLAATIETDFPSGAPPDLQEAVRQLAAHLYENREASVIGNTPSVLPFGLWDLIGPYRLMSF